MLTLNSFFSRLNKSSLFKDSFWALLGNVLGKGLALIAGIAIANFLGNETYGEYGMIRNNLTMIAIFSSFGLGYTATKFIAESKKENSSQVYQTHKVVTHITWSVSGIIAIIVAIFANHIATWLEASDLANLLRISAIAIMLNAINTTQTGELSGFNAYKAIARNNLWSGIVTFILSVVLTYLYNILGAVIALVFSLLTNCILNKISLNKYIKQIPTIRIQKSDYIKIARFSFPVALQESSYSLTHWIGTVILIKMASYGELGIYSAATQWMAVMLFVPGALRNVTLSHLSESNSNIKINKRILKQMAMINLISTLIPFIVIASISGWLCSLYGESYNGLQSVLNICMFTTIINSLTNVITQNMIALNQNWFLFYSRLARDLFTMGMAYCIMYFGGKGALSMALSSLILQSAYLVLLFIKQSNLYNKQIAAENK